MFSKIWNPNLNPSFGRQCEQVVEADVYICCCDKTFPFRIEAVRTEICYLDCTIKATLIVNNDDAKAYEKLKNQLWFNDDLINSIDVPVFQNEDVSGTFRSCHPAPRIRDVLQYWADTCGLNFKSSILQSTVYQDAVILFASNTNNIDTNGDCVHTEWDYDNVSPWTVFELLDNLEPVFNARWEISNGTLCLERVDFYNNISNLFPVEDFVSKGLCLQYTCLLYTSPSPRDATLSRMPSSA